MYKTNPVPGDVQMTRRGLTVFDGEKFCLVGSNGYYKAETFEEGLNRYNITEKEMFKLIKKYLPDRLL